MLSMIFTGSFVYFPELSYSCSLVCRSAVLCRDSHVQKQNEENVTDQIQKERSTCKGKIMLENDCLAWESGNGTWHVLANPGISRHWDPAPVWHMLPRGFGSDLTPWHFRGEIFFRMLHGLGRERSSSQIAWLRFFELNTWGWAQWGGFAAKMVGAAPTHCCSACTLP